MYAFVLSVVLSADPVYYRPPTPQQQVAADAWWSRMRAQSRVATPSRTDQLLERQLRFQEQIQYETWRNGWDRRMDRGFYWRW